MGPLAEAARAEPGVRGGVGGVERHAQRVDPRRDQFGNDFAAFPEAGEPVRVQADPADSRRLQAPGHLEQHLQPPRRLAEPGEDHLGPALEPGLQRRAPHLVGRRSADELQVVPADDPVAVPDLRAEDAGEAARARQVQVESVPEPVREHGAGDGGVGVRHETLF
jgi:hypothetical protein